MNEQTDIAKLSARRKPTPSGLTLAARIREGATVVTLAAEFEVSKSKIARAVNDAGLSTADGLSAMRTYVDAVRLPSVAHEWLGYTEALNGAACFDAVLHPDAWFPDTAAQRATTGRQAKALCAECPVAVACLTRALEEEANGVRHGIRAGLDEDERAALVESGAA